MDLINVSIFGVMKEIFLQKILSQEFRNEDVHCHFEIKYEFVPAFEINKYEILLQNISLH